MIPTSGLYRVKHTQHRLPQEVSLIMGEKFPPCAKCNNSVQFELVMGIRDSTPLPFRVVLNQIPEEQEETKAAAASAKGKAS